MEISQLEQEFKDYEAAFVGIGEELVKEVTAVLSELGINILMTGSARELNLAYPIKKHKNGFFFSIQFQTLPSKIAELKDKLALKENILRFLIITPPVKKQAERSIRSVSFDRAEKISQPLVQPDRERPAEILSNELLEQKLEEILQ